MNRFERELRTMKEKIQLNEKEREEIWMKINENIERHREKGKRTTAPWKYAGSLAVVLAVFLIISFSVFQQLGNAPAGDEGTRDETPVPVEEAKEKELAVEDVEKFLPENAVLAKARHPENVQAVQRADLDKDGIREVVATYEIKAEEEPGPSTAGVIVIKKKAEKWEKVWEKEAQGAGLDFALLVDVTGDGTEELLFGVTIGASAGNQLEIFQWKSDKFAPMTEMFYHELEIVSNGKTGLAFWDRFMADAYIVNVASWNGTEFMYDKELYKKYYPAVQAYYEEKLARMDAWFYWYALADAQMKADLLEKAKSSIEKGIELARKEQITDAAESLERLKSELEKKGQ